MLFGLDEKIVVALVVGSVLAAFLIIRTRRNVLVPPSASSVGSSGPYTKAEVAKHNDPDDAWIIVEGKVYDVTRYIDDHPGGASILNQVGDDATKGFNGPQHPETARNILDMYYIGDLIS